MNFSKTKYVEFTRCLKAAWLTAHKPEVRKIDGSLASAAEGGIKLGEIAKGYFGEYVDMTTYKADGSLDLATMAEKTKKAIADGKKNICEAAFIYDGLYCAVDILHKAKRGDIDGYEIYEVKSSTEMKEHYYHDIAYQEYVAQKCGVKILDRRVLYINSDYVRHGDIDVKKLLIPDDKGKRLLRQMAGGMGVPVLLNEAEDCLRDEEFDFIGKGNEKCGDWCGYWEYCSRNLPKPNVFDLYDFRKKYECYNNGIISFDDILKSGIPLREVQRRQIEYSFKNSETYVDKERIKEFLNTLYYPLYFLDFETVRFAVPEFDGTCPYQHIPFQYSLHFIADEGEELNHKEFLAEPTGDPRRALAERLCNDIPEGACILAYNSRFERDRIKELAEEFPDLSEKLTAIRFSIVDLLPVFKNGYYYNRAMGGAFTIKSVLPAVFPELDYHNLEGVQNGTEAMNIFPKMKYMSSEERERTRRQLLKYCGLDTFAMVKLWQELVKVSK